MTDSLALALGRIERLITRDAESFTDPGERQTEFQRRLERTRRLMAALGDPEESFDSIHIGGTSGKGSVAMLCESILLAHGRRVGTHTTPYLQTALEKARVDGALIAADDAISLTDVVMDMVDQVRRDEALLGAPHYAEAWLGLALLYFAVRGCEVGVIEVGMGGRYDCTNIINPRVSVISSVHYDHVRVLGDTLAEIAYHKAGIIKPGVPVVVGEIQPEAMRVIEDEARRQGARLIRAGREIGCEPLEIGQRAGRFSYRGLHLSLDDAAVGLLGRHQFTNATLAIAALETLAEGQDDSLDPAAVRVGLAEARFAGRLEVVQKSPLVVLDGAHNQEKIEALASALPEVFRYRRIILILGMLETKTAGPILARLTGLADVIITTAPHVRGKPAVPADALAQMTREAGGRDVRAGGDPLEALDQALALAGSDDLIVVTGSLYMIGAVRGRYQPTEAIIARRTMFANDT